MTAAAAAAAKRVSRWISYCRVSTDQQGIRGLGIEAQRAAIAAYVDRSGGELVEEYVEVESGKRADRPQLREALAACQRQSWGWWLFRQPSSCFRQIHNRARSHQDSRSAGLRLRSIL